MHNRLNSDLASVIGLWVVHNSNLARLQRNLDLDITRRIRPRSKRAATDAVGTWAPTWLLQTGWMTLRPVISDTDCFGRRISNSFSLITATGEEKCVSTKSTYRQRTALHHLPINFSCAMRRRTAHGCGCWQRWVAANCLFHNHVTPNLPCNQIKRERCEHALFLTKTNM